MLLWLIDSCFVIWVSWSWVSWSWLAGLRWVFFVRWSCREGLDVVGLVLCCGAGLDRIAVVGVGVSAADGVCELTLRNAPVGRGRDST
jgi:hypothetical protein